MDKSRAGVLLLLVLALILPATNADFVFKLKVLTYENLQRTLGPPTDITCCDSPNQQLPPQCTDSCDNKFNFCLRDSDIQSGTRDVSVTCTHEVYGTRPIHSDIIQFGMEFQLSSSSAVSTASNPLTFSGNTWPDNAQVAIEVIDADDPQGPANDQYIDTVLVNVSTLLPSSSYTPISSYTGLLGHSTFCMSFFLECAENFYGQDCSTFCQSRNDASGHYACDPSGGIVCLDGYIGANTSCVQCSPMQGCSSTGGYCNSPGECLCQAGYTGTHCEIDMDPCGHSVPCLHGGNCTNTGPDHYKCTCYDNYVGVDCHDTTYECNQGTCLNEGMCMGNECLCAVGFSGRQCEVISGGDMTIIIIASSVLAIGILTTIVITAFIIICIFGKRRRKRVERMKGTKVSDTDRIQLHLNPGYACLPGQGSPTPIYERYYSEISEYVNDGMGPVRSASLPTTTHLAVDRAARRQTAPHGVKLNTPQLPSTDPIHSVPRQFSVTNTMLHEYQHYENEGMGPKKQQKCKEDQQQEVSLQHPTEPPAAGPALASPDHNYAIPYASSSTNLIA